MDIARAQIIEETEPAPSAYVQSFSFFPRLSLRGRAIALITLLVATIVGVYTNLRSETGFSLKRWRSLCLAGQEK
jgi:hypothetical protein